MVHTLPALLALRVLEETDSRSRVSSKGLTARTIADAMGHRKTATTEIYIQRFNGPERIKRCGSDDQLNGVSTTKGRGEPGEDASEVPRSVRERFVFRPRDSP